MTLSSFSSEGTTVSIPTLKSSFLIVTAALIRMAAAVFGGTTFYNKLV